jgi:hypothetical protein
VCHLANFVEKHSSRTKSGRRPRTCKNYSESKLQDFYFSKLQRVILNTPQKQYDIHQIFDPFIQLSSYFQ